VSKNDEEEKGDWERENAIHGGRWDDSSLSALKVGVFGPTSILN
jgi:hypothetical protein